MIACFCLSIVLFQKTVCSFFLFFMTIENLTTILSLFFHNVTLHAIHFFSFPDPSLLYHTQHVALSFELLHNSIICLSG